MIATLKKALAHIDRTADIEDQIAQVEAIDLNCFVEVTFPCGLCGEFDRADRAEAIEATDVYFRWLISLATIPMALGPWTYSAAHPSIVGSIAYRIPLGAEAMIAIADRCPIYDVVEICGPEAYLPEVEGDFWIGDELIRYRLIC